MCVFENIINKVEVDVEHATTMKKISTIYSLEHCCFIHTYIFFIELFPHIFMLNLYLNTGYKGMRYRKQKDSKISNKNVQK